MDSAEHLALELDKVGLHDMARQARAGRYHEYRSTLALPAMQLDRDLAKAVSAGNVGAVTLRHRHYRGEFETPENEAEPIPALAVAAFKEIRRAMTPAKPKKRARKKTA